MRQGSLTKTRAHTYDPSALSRHRRTQLPKLDQCRFQTCSRSSDQRPETARQDASVVGMVAERDSHLWCVSLVSRKALDRPHQHYKLSEHDPNSDRGFCKCHSGRGQHVQHAARRSANRRQPDAAVGCHVVGDVAQRFVVPGCKANVPSFSRLLWRYLLIFAPGGHCTSYPRRARRRSTECS